MIESPLRATILAEAQKQKPLRGFLSQGLSICVVMAGLPRKSAAEIRNQNPEIRKPDVIQLSEFRILFSDMKRPW